MTDNVVNPFDAEMARRTQEAGAKAAQHYAANLYPHQHPVVQQQREVNGRQFTSMDALLGEVLREVLEMRQQVAALQDRVEDIAEAARAQPQPAMPPNALRHGTPR